MTASRYLGETKPRNDMQASWSVSKDGAFVCEADDLERLTKLLESHVGEVSWEIACADGIDRSGQDLTALLDFDNAPNRRIQRLRLRARGNNAQCSASVRLGCLFNVLDVSIDGPVEFVEQLRPALESQLYGLRAWYDPLARMDFVQVVFLLLLAAVLVATLAVAFDLIDSSNESPGPTARGQARLYMAIGGAAVVGWGLNKIRERLFPPVTFAIGQGKRRHENLEQIRWGVIVAFAVSLLAGLLLLGLS